jgi:hypothetical protein
MFESSVITNSSCADGCAGLASHRQPRTNPDASGHDRASINCPTITREFKSGERIHANNVTLPRAPWEAAPTPPAPEPTEPTFATKPRDPVWLSGRIGARPALRRAEPAADRFEAFEAALIAKAEASEPVLGTWKTGSQQGAERETRLAKVAIHVAAVQAEAARNGEIITAKETADRVAERIGRSPTQAYDDVLELRRVERAAAKVGN